MKKLGQLLFNNLGLKIFSLAVALAVWFFVVIANKPELNFVVPLRFVNVPPKMELIREEDYELEVRVKGSQAQINALSARQIEALVDLGDAKAGDMVYNLTPADIELPAGLQISRVVPGRVKLRLEQLMERMVPVEPVVLGVPAEGYELKNVAVFPDQVRVQGAQSRVEELKSVRTASLNIAGFNSSVSKKLDLLPLEGNVRYTNGSVVEVRAIIGEKEEERELTVPVKTSPVSWKAVIEPPRVKVTAKGAISRIRALKEDEITAVVDLLELKPEQINLAVTVGVPENIQLLKTEPEKIKVISIEKNTQGEMLRPTIGGSPPPVPAKQ